MKWKSISGPRRSTYMTTRIWPGCLIIITISIIAIYEAIRCYTGIGQYACAFHVRANSSTAFGGEERGYGHQPEQGDHPL